MFKSWEEAALYCERVFATYVNWKERFFLCPECAEPLYECDWEDHDDWTICPICEVAYEEM